MNFSHQSGYLPRASDHHVTIVGVGSVGSKVADMLVRLGVRVTVYDGDSVESHNVPSSLYGVGDIMRFKVDALRDKIHRETGVSIETYRKMYEGESLRGTVVSCVDTIEARQAIWGKVHNNPFVDLLVDTRVTEEFFQLYVVRPTHSRDRSHYTLSLDIKPGEASEQFCGRHSVPYVSSIVAGSAVFALVNFWRCGKTEVQSDTLLGVPMFIVAS
jgi:hypothetical protein